MRNCGRSARRSATLGIGLGLLAGCSVYDESLLEGGGGSGGTIADSGAAGQDFGGGGGESGVGGEISFGGLGGAAGTETGGETGTGGDGGAAGAAADLIVILTNRTLAVSGAQTRFYVAVGANSYLEWSATTVDTAEKFERVVVSGDQIKLRAQSTGAFVGLDQSLSTEMNQTALENDELIANTDEAGAAVLNTALCTAANGFATHCKPNCRGIQVMGDDDNANWVTSDDQFQPFTRGMRARGPNCGASDTSWESFEFQTAAGAPL